MIAVLPASHWDDNIRPGELIMLANLTGPGNDQRVVLPRPVSGVWRRGDFGKVRIVS
jgi:hypothetical protein